MRACGCAQVAERLERPQPKHSLECGSCTSRASLAVGKVEARQVGSEHLRRVDHHILLGEELRHVPRIRGVGHNELVGRVRQVRVELGSVGVDMFDVTERRGERVSERGGPRPPHVIAWCRPEEQVLPAKAVQRWDKPPVEVR